MSDLGDARLRRACQETYRAAWLKYFELLKATPGISADEMTAKGRLQRLMDSVQPYCCQDGRPCDEWRAFTATLPGYNDFWDAPKRLIADCLAKAKEDKARRGVDAVDALEKIRRGLALRDNPTDDNDPKAG